MQTSLKTIIAPKGIGYYDLTSYPIGGHFKRLKEDTAVQLTIDYKEAGLLRYAHGCTHEAVMPDGRKIAICVDRLNFGDQA